MARGAREELCTTHQSAHRSEPGEVRARKRRAWIGTISSKHQCALWLVARLSRRECNVRAARLHVQAVPGDQHSTPAWEWEVGERAHLGI
jgi:hypothetical protein